MKKKKYMNTKDIVKNKLIKLLERIIPNLIYEHEKYKKIYINKKDIVRNKLIKLITSIYSNVNLSN